MNVDKDDGLRLWIWPPSHKQMWIMRGGPPGQMSVLFHYDKTRAKSVAERLLRVPIFRAMAMRLMTRSVKLRESSI